MQDTHIFHICSHWPSQTFLHQGICHDSVIPPEISSKIPRHEKLALLFVLDYIQWKKVPIEGVFINGGFVRDLLLRKCPDDLDISLCLNGCQEGVTVQAILQGIPAYIAHLTARVVRKRYHIASFKSLIIQGDSTKNKNIDTAKAIFTMLDRDGTARFL
jgi:tRNA nucleotidyltransferase/poly(A) polymerase